MKRFLAVILGLILIASGLCFAEADYSSMSDEELLAERAAISKEMAARNLNDDDIIYDGIYVVGEDIKASTFELTGLGYNGDYTYVFVFVWDENEKEANRAVLHVGEKASICLKDGYTMSVRQGYASIVEKKNSFAP